MKFRSLFVAFIAMFFVGVVYAQTTVYVVAVNNNTAQPYYYAILKDASAPSGVTVKATALLPPSTMGQGGTINVTSTSPPNGTVSVTYYISRSASLDEKIGDCTFVITFTPTSTGTSSKVTSITQDCETKGSSVSASSNLNALPPTITINN